MEQKTEASQAVDERQSMMEALSRCIDALDGDADRKQREFAQANAVRVLGGAALKAQPSPTEAAQGEDSARLDAIQSLRLLAEYDESQATYHIIMDALKVLDPQTQEQS